MKYQELITKNIKRLRLSLGLTQEIFAEKAGLTVQGLSNIERNKYQPNSETIDRICEAFNIAPAQLLLSPEHLDNKNILMNINAMLNSCNTKELSKIHDIVKIFITK